MPKPHPNRRIFLRASGGLLVAGLRGNPGLGGEPSPTTPATAAGRGRRFLAELFDPTIGLLPEFRGSKVYWLYHDNYLAAKVLDRSEPDLAAKIRAAIKGLGVTGSGKIEILFGEVKDPLPLRHHRLIEVKRIGEKVIRTELVGDRPNAGWQEYTDLLFLGSIAEASRDRAEAVRHFEMGLATWDGTGFKDRVNRDKGLYATYKLALALIAADRLGLHPEVEESIVNRLLSMHRADGGFVTDHDAQGRLDGQANVETTSLAILALDGLAQA